MAGLRPVHCGDVEAVRDRPHAAGVIPATTAAHATVNPLHTVISQVTPPLVARIETAQPVRDRARWTSGTPTAARASGPLAGCVATSIRRSRHWTRMLAAGVYRALCDPDGRPARLRRHHEF
jgi:hypothetical protein